MRVLLDTHAFLWAIAQESKLSDRVRKLLPNANTWFSVASIWEILIKVQSKKLPFPEPAGPYLISKLVLNGVQILPVDKDHVMRIEHLPLHHRDPFDRMLIAQSLEENLPLISADPIFRRYPVDLIW